MFWSVGIKALDCWLQSQGQLIEVLLKVWCDEKFHEKHSQIDNLNHIYWKEPIYVLKVLLKYHEIQLALHARNEATYALNSNIELLFKLLIAFHQKSLSQFEFFRVYLHERVAKKYSIQLKRDIFFTFVQIFTNSNLNTIYTQKLKSSILQHIIIPCFTCAFENGEHEAIIGGAPTPDTDSSDNIISVFINNVVDPDQNQNYSDAVRIHLLQLSCLFVQYAHDYIHNVNNKKQGTKLRRLMTFAWPSLLAKTCVDPFNKYQGLLLLSHIISKFAIHKRIVFQVFHSLLKAYAPEAKLVVRQALQILTPTFPTRSEDGYITLASWTKKILIEENHSVPQLSHLIFIIVRYFKVFYYIRHTLINQLIVALQKVGLSQNSTNENKLLIIDLCETILKWEAQRTLDCDDANFEPNLKAKHADLLKPFDKHICDFVMNFLIRFACQMAPPQAQEAAQNSNTNLNEQLCRKCLNLFQMAIKNDLLSNFDLKLEILDKILTSLESTFGQNPLVTNVLGAHSSVHTTTQINLNQVYICLEILSFLIEHTSKQKIQLILKSLHRGFQYSIVSTNSKVIKLIASIIQKLMLTIPNELFNTMSSNNECAESSNTAATATATATAAEPIYSLFGQPDGVLCRMILESLSYYEKMSLINPSETSCVNLAIDILTNCLVLIKAASVNNHQYIDRLMGPILKIIQKLYRDHLNSIGSVGQLVSSQEGANVVQAQNSVQVYLFSELIIQVIDLVKNRVGVMSSEMRKMFVNQILVNLIDKSIDLRLIKYLVKLINDWIKMSHVTSHVTNVLPNQIPTMKEKLVLLQKLTVCMDKKYSDQAEIQSVFLDTISYVYQNEAYLAQQEFKCKLEQAFLLGMKSPNVKMRQLFYDLFDRNFQSNDLYERLCFVLVTQNWELFGTYYWIKQCIQLTLGSCYNLNFVNNTFEPKFLSLVEAQNVPLGSNAPDFSRSTSPTSCIQIDDQDTNDQTYQLIAPLDFFEVDFSKKGIR
ncbi:Transformation transcription domain-associated [Brachionus plicatilis]|uniref:Transformation transcription domain-associated n=1 Tax=Brachionus plicatilis TaxID=10195 RepID=A0A3M7PW49_BRAPC|nr:Transformation transcription domain-associated [Brachionus plicatilis]